MATPDPNDVKTINPVPEPTRPSAVPATAGPVKACGSPTPDFPRLARVLKGEEKHPGIEQSGSPTQGGGK